MLLISLDSLNSLKAINNAGTLVSKTLGNNKIIHGGEIFKAIMFHLLETLTPTKMVGIQD